MSECERCKGGFWGAAGDRCGGVVAGAPETERRWAKNDDVLCEAGGVFVGALVGAMASNSCDTFGGNDAGCVPCGDVGGCTTRPGTGF